MPRFLLLGDSITQQGCDVAHRGWVAQLADAYARKADVVARGYSGYNTRWVRERLDAIAATLTPAGGAGFEIGTVFLGANDNANGPQHVPLPEYKENLAAIVDALRGPAFQCATVLVLSPAPHDDHALNYGPNCPAKRTDARHREYGAAAKEVAAAAGVAFVDLHAAVTTALGAQWQRAFHDGLHLAAPGNDAVAAAVLAAIRAARPDLAPDSMPLPPGLPHWSELADATAAAAATDPAPSAAQ